MYWAADRRGGPVRKPKCIETEEYPGKWPCRRTGPGYCSGAGLSGKRGQGGTSLRARGHMGPLPTSAASAARRTPRTRRLVASFNLKFKNERPAASDVARGTGPCHCDLSDRLLPVTLRLRQVSSYADIRGVRRAADAVEVGKGPVCPLVPPWPRLGAAEGLRPAPGQ